MLKESSRLPDRGRVMLLGVATLCVACSAENSASGPPSGALGPSGVAGNAATLVGGEATSTAGSASTEQIPATNGEPGTGSATAAPACAPGEVRPIPFRVVPRLNRAEYDNTVRDLLGHTGHLALDVLPEDPGDGGFDNNSGALSLNPTLVELYEDLAVALAEETMTLNRAAVVTCDPAAAGEDACAAQIATDFGARAFRRPLEAGEADRLLGVYTEVRGQGFTFDEGVTAVVQAALLSPHFLFRPELDATVAETGERPATGYEMANRLSYFLWSSMPDQQLLDAAAAGSLDSETGITDQAVRMLADVKAESLYSRFPGLWLETADIGIRRRPTTAVFPNYDDELETAMEQETAMFMREFMVSDVSFLDFLDADFSYINQRLAQHYGLAGTYGPTLERVTLDATSRRGGILTQGSVLTVTSPSERTSPVIRGQWVLTRMLNAPPPPPPPDVVAVLEEEGSSATPTTTREKLEKHREDPSCAACHALMDPIGFGLENFDATGAWRDVENGAPVDASGVLITGESFTGAEELTALLKTDPRMARGVVAYMLSYALGRIIYPNEDRCRLDLAADAFATSGHRMSGLITRLAVSDAMRNRRMAP